MKLRTLVKGKSTTFLKMHSQAVVVCIFWQEIISLKKNEVTSASDITFLLLWRIGISVHFTCTLLYQMFIQTAQKNPFKIHVYAIFTKQCGFRMQSIQWGNVFTLSKGDTNIGEHACGDTFLTFGLWISLNLLSTLAMTV